MRTLPYLLMMFAFTAGAAQAEDACLYREKLTSAEEQGELSKTHGAVARRGDALEIHTASGLREFRNTDCSGESPMNDCAQYIFVAQPLPNQYLVHVQLWEGEAYLLVSRLTGKSISIDSYPWLSPSKNEFILSTGDNNYDFNRLEIWSVARDDIRMAWSLTAVSSEKDEQFYCFRGWRHEGAALLTGGRRFSEASDGKLSPEREEYWNAILLHDKQIWSILP